jgi:nucleotide-binding universal stress UspA family protein
MTGNGQQAGVVVCGIDGSNGSRHALAEALRTAARRGDRVRAVAVYEPPEMWAAWGYGPAAAMPIPGGQAIQDQEEKAAREMVAEVTESVRAELGTVPETTVEAIAGGPAQVLVDLAREADELVVGHRGRGALGSMALGSVGLGCVLHASCPVTVVPEPVPA